FLASVATGLNQFLWGVFIHPASRAGPGLFIPHTNGVTLCAIAGENLSLYPMAYVAPHALPGWRSTEDAGWPRLGDNVRVGIYAAAIGGVAIGDGVVLGVHAVVERDVEPGVVVISRPNWRIIRRASAASAKVPERADV